MDRLDLNFVISELKRLQVNDTVIKPEYILRYKGDLIGLLLELGLPSVFHEAVLVINEIDDVNNFTGPTLLLPAEGVPEEILGQLDEVYTRS